MFHPTTNRLPTTLALGAALCLVLSACGGAKANAKSDGAAAEPAAATTAAALPETATCPVSGEVFKPTAETKTATYNGKTYYMCCPGCAKKFAANPTQYVGGPAPEAAPQPADAPATTGDAAGAKKPDCDCDGECDDAAKAAKTADAGKKGDCAGDCDDCDDAAKAK